MIITNKPIVILDNGNDSFTFNLVELLRSWDFAVKVIPTHDLHQHLDQLAFYDKFIISPGADVPSAYPNLWLFMDKYKATKSIFGVCLGMQFIAVYFLVGLKQIEPRHGKAGSLILNVAGQKDKLCSNISYESTIGLYHSWCIESDFTANLEILAVDEEDIPMLIKHKQLDIYGVQYHPESFLTQESKFILLNWLNF